MTNLVRQGILIVFEGTDGTGKSTQLQLLSQYLKSKGYPVITTREPTEGQYGQKIRSLYVNRNKYSQEEELELFLADRREHVQQLLIPALSRGKLSSVIGIFFLPLHIRAPEALILKIF